MTDKQMTEFDRGVEAMRKLAADYLRKESDILQKIAWRSFYEGNDADIAKKLGYAGEQVLRLAELIGDNRVVEAPSDRR